MATSLGVRIGIEGGKDFIDEVRRITSETKALKAAFEDVSKLKDPFEKAGSQTEILTEAIKKGEEKLRVYNDQLQKATEKYGENSGQANRWREEIFKANSELQNLKDTLSNISTASIEIKGLGTFKRDLETMTTAVSAFKSEFKNFENMQGLSNVFTKASGMKTSLSGEIKAQEEVVKLLAEDYEKAARESGAFSQNALDLRGKLADATTELNNMRRELKELPNGLMLAGDEVKTFGSKVQNIGSGLSSVGRSTRVVSGAATGILGGIIKESADFEKQMSQVAKVQGLNVKASEEDAAAYKKLEERARELGRTTVFSAVEAAEALEILGRAGLDVEEAIALSGPALDLAAAEEMEFAEATSILVDNLNALGYEKNYDNARKLADVLAQTSRSSNTNVSMLGESMKYSAAQASALGWGMEDLSLMLGLAADFGVKASQAGTGLRQGLKNLIDPTDQSAEAMKKFGISLDDGKGGIVDATKFLTQIRNAFGDLNVNVFDANGELKEGEAIMEEYADALPVTQMEKLQAICSIFGTRAMPTMLALIRTAPEDFNELSSAITTASGAAQEMADTAIDNLAGEWTLLVDQVKDLALEFGKTLVPVLREGLETIRKLVAGFSGMDEGTKKMILKVLAATAAFSPFFRILGGITSGIGGIIKIGGTLLTGIGKVVRFGGNLLGIGSSVASGINGSVLPAVGSLGSAIGGGAAGTAATGGIIGKLGGLVKAAGPFLLKGAVIVGAAAGVVWLGKKIYENWDEISGFLKKCWEGIKNFAKTIFEGIASVISKVWEGIKSAAKWVWDGITSMLSGIWNGLKGIASWALEGLSNIFSGVWQGIKSAASWAWDGITSMLSGIWGGLKGLASWALDGIGDIFAGAWEGIKNVASWAWNGISSMLGGIWSGLKGLASWALDGVCNVFSKAWDFIGWAAGGIGNAISSAASWGWDMIKGFGNGVASAAGWLWDGIKNIGSGIASFLGFSVPEKGPLSDADEWGPDMMKLFSSGIEENAWRVMDAVSGMGSEVRARLNEIAAAPQNAGEAFEEMGSSIVRVSDNIQNSFSDAASWGTNLTNNVASGIRSGISTVASAAREMASRISDYLHHSTPDLGPLKDDDKWMPDMMKNLATGIRDGIPLVKSAAKQAADAMAASHYSFIPETGGGRTVSMGGVNFTINAQPGQDPEEIAQVVERRLTNMIVRQQYAYS